MLAIPGLRSISRLLSVARRRLLSVAGLLTIRRLLPVAGLTVRRLLLTVGCLLPVARLSVCRLPVARLAVGGLLLVSTLRRRRRVPAVVASGYAERSGDDGDHGLRDDRMSLLHENPRFARLAPARLAIHR